MQYYGRDRRRRYRKILKRALLAFAAVVVFMIGRFLFSNTGNAHEDVVSVAAIGNAGSSNEILPDTVLFPEKRGLQNDSKYLAEQRNDEEKNFSKNEESDEAVVNNLKNKKITSFHRLEPKVIRSFYQVLSEAHFYDKPTEKSRRKDVIEYWNVTSESIKPLKEKNDFVYVLYQQPMGPAKKGWLRKKDLKKVTTSYENNKD
ncbi:MAG TPA: hypothetical protein VLJ41_13485 [Segetibacter sp.]|nr:hypothetical protein [Segetibacter sp.]